MNVLLITRSEIICLFALLFCYEFFCYVANVALPEKLAVGFAVSTGCETMEEILEEADRKMYAEKTQMKQKG